MLQLHYLQAAASTRKLVSLGPAPGIAYLSVGFVVKQPRTRAMPASSKALPRTWNRLALLYSEVQLLL
jgi:hypothetical protein